MTNWYEVTEPSGRLSDRSAPRRARRTRPLSRLRTLTDIAELKIGLVELGLDRRDEERRSVATAEIGRQFVTELGGLGRVWMSSKLGLDPDLTEILAIVSDDEKLVATLKEPAVREMLKDEATRAELAMMLQLAAARHKAQADAAKAPATDGAAAA